MSATAEVTDLMLLRTTMSFRKITMGRAIGSEKVDKDNTGKTVWQYNTYGPDKDPELVQVGDFLRHPQS